jgi:hypothetical protein
MKREFFMVNLSPSAGRYLWLGLLLLFFCCKKNNVQPPPGTFQLVQVQVGSVTLNLSQQNQNTSIPVDQPIVITFSDSLDVTSVPKTVFLLQASDTIPLSFSFLNGNKSISAKPSFNLKNNSAYSLVITNQLKSASGETFPGFNVSFTTISATLSIVSFIVSGENFLQSAGRITNVNRNFPAIVQFNHPLDPSQINASTISVSGPTKANIAFALSDSNKSLNLSATSPLIHFDKYTVTLTNQIKGANGEAFAEFTKVFYTAIDSIPKFPVVSDDDLLTLVQQQTFKYFWDFAEPNSGMARERNTSGNLVTTGGSGFGVMAILTGIQRNFISRQEGVDRLEKIVNFLSTADRFHGVWPHWIDGTTGKIIPFSAEDDGGDLVETAYMIEGLLAVRQFLNSTNPQEDSIINKINSLWQSVEWDWYTNGQNVLFWHWSPDHDYEGNFEVNGYDEALITYFLAAASPTHPITKQVYTNGWALNGTIENGNSYFGFVLPVGAPYGGPLFFTHYSFLGLNPHNLSDQYANYWTQNTNHTLINHAYCSQNPAGWVGYSSVCWGLTASDDPKGYDAHSPTNDNGTITPTCVSSIPYDPDDCLNAIKFFYYTVGDKMWGPYGFYDAFNVTDSWWAKSYLAIDEGPIIDMIENYRSGLLWNLFMSAPEVTTAMNVLGFSN